MHATHWLICAQVNAALATLTYEAPPDYHSDRLAKEVQVVRAYAPPSLFAFAVRTWATGNALVDGTFTLRLNCDYLCGNQPVCRVH